MVSFRTRKPAGSNTGLGIRTARDVAAAKSREQKLAKEALRKEEMQTKRAIRAIPDKDMIIKGGQKRLETRDVAPRALYVPPYDEGLKSGHLSTRPITVADIEGRSFYKQPLGMRSSIVSIDSTLDEVKETPLNKSFIAGALDPSRPELLSGVQDIPNPEGLRNSKSKQGELAQQREDLKQAIRGLYKQAQEEGWSAHEYTTHAYLNLRRDLKRSSEQVPALAPAVSAFLPTAEKLGAVVREALGPELINERNRDRAVETATTTLNRLKAQTHKTAADKVMHAEEVRAAQAKLDALKKLAEEPGDVAIPLEYEKDLDDAKTVHSTTDPGEYATRWLGKEDSTANQLFSIVRSRMKRKKK